MRNLLQFSFSSHHHSYLLIDNQGMSGNLPAEIEHLFELNTIDFSDNDVVGNIPPRWSSLSKLSKFKVCILQVSTCFHLLCTFNLPTFSIAVLNVKNTKLTGEVPSRICSLRSGALVSFDVDCSEVICSCCTNCESGSRSTDIRDKVKAISFKSGLNESQKEEDDRRDALDWVSHVDKFDLDVSSDNFNERYVLVVFYFSLNGDSWNKVTSPNVQWLSKDVHHCDWGGIDCDVNKFVVAIRMRKFPVTVKHHPARGCLPLI